MKEKLIDIARRAVDEARAGGMEAEAFVLHGKDLSIEVVDGQVETLKEAEELGLGLRVNRNGRIGFAYTTDLEGRAVKETLERAWQAAEYAGEDPFQGLAEGTPSYPEVYTLDSEIEKTALEAKIELAREVERQARASDRRVSVIERAGYEDSVYTVAIMNTNGVEAAHKGAYCGLYVLLVAEENGDAQTGFSVASSRRFAALDPVAVGKEGAASAVRSLGGRTMASQSLPCVFEPYVMTSFLGVLADSFSADSVQKGKSALAGKIGQEVASPVVSIVDDGLYENGVGSFPFDGEGSPCQRTVLIENGRLRGFLYDNYTARKEGIRSTGNGSRGSFRGLPSVGTTNYFLMPGQEEPARLLEGISRGVYVTEVMGMHTANPISGDFSVGASGILIENGKLACPVRGLTVAGNLFDFLRDIEGVGNDLRFFGETGSPTVRVKKLSIAGE